MACLARIENREVSSWSASQKLKSSTPMWHWRKHYLCLKQKKNCWRTFYAGENTVYVILSRSLMRRLFFCWTATTKVKAAQGLQLLMQLLKDFEEIWRKTSVQHDSLYCSLLLFYRFLLPRLGYAQHVVLSLTCFHECALISWREMKEPYHTAFSFKLEKILYTDWSE